MGGKRHCEGKVSWPRTQHNDPSHWLQPRPLDPEASALTMRPPRLPGNGNDKEPEAVNLLLMQIKGEYSFSLA